MTPKPKIPFYPKSHLLAASGVAALLSLALLVFPSSEVEAKKSGLDLTLSTDPVQSITQMGGLDEFEGQDESNASPFASIEPSTDDESTQTTEASSPEHPGTTIKVANGDTLSTVFNKVGLSANDLHEVLNSSKDARRFSKLRVGQELQFTLSAEGKLQGLSTSLNRLESVHLERTDDGFAFKHDKVTPTVRQSYAHGIIDSSLFLAARNAGLPHSLTMDLANIFGYDIDFALDIRQGDEFEVIYEDKTVDGESVGSGEILAARFVNKGKSYTAVRYANKQNSVSYYTAEGNSMRKAFIRTPVDFARISSRFSLGRKHPVLNKIRAHKGVDYAAPRGTPIKATGNGRIITAGGRGGYGNTVVIQHGKSYRTLYAHMQGFAKGIRSGANVRQGQVIGYVGTTGLSTGPHLHYEFQVNGTHVDPLSLKLPMADPIPAGEKQRFLQVSKPLMARMEQERDTKLALNTQQ